MLDCPAHRQSGSRQRLLCRQRSLVVRRATPDALDAAKLLDIDVDQLTGAVSLVSGEQRV